MSKGPDPEAWAELSATVRQVAVLLEAGLPLRGVWRHVPSSAIAQTIARHDSRGKAPGAAILAAAADHAGDTDRWVWSSIAACVITASRVGAPLAAALRYQAESIASICQVRRDIEVALASPRATAQLMLGLPVVGVIGSAVLGFDTVGVLLLTPTGWLVLAAGTGLLLGARVWTRRLEAHAQPPPIMPGLQVDLMAIAVVGGASHSRARAVVEAALTECGLGTPDHAVVDDVLALSRRAGVPAAELLRSAATELRSKATAQARAVAARLTVSLLIPMGVCVLPAFVVLCVVPIVLAIVSSTGVLD